jgi:hypothetical protein
MEKRLEKAKRITEELLSTPKYYFSTLTPSMLTEGLAVVYAITDQTNGEVLYVGRTKNLRRRLYTNHLMGPLTNARLKKYLIDDPTMPQIEDKDTAKEYIKKNCYFQYIPVQKMVERGQIEGLLSFMLNVRYMHEEH